MRPVTSTLAPISNVGATLLLALTLAGCHHAAPVPPPGPMPPQTPPIAVQKAAQESFEAMISVSAHAYWRGNPPPALALLPLDTAVQRLNAAAAAGSDRTAASRRRRAIARLAAYGVGTESVDAALRKLGAPIEVIQRRLREEERRFGAAFALDASARETFIADLPDVAGQQDTADLATGDTNCWKKISSRIYHVDRLISIVVDVEATNTVERVARGIDPQSWDECGLAWKTGNGTYFAHLDSANNVIRDPEITPHGQAFSSRTLYENFVCQSVFCSAQFELLLGMEATKSTDYYHVEFWLSPQDGYPKGTVYGKPEKLIVDGGNLEVKASSVPGTSLVHGQKGFAYQDETTTDAVFHFLELKELADELGELACCFQ